MSASGTPGGRTRRNTDSAALLAAEGLPGVLPRKGVLEGPVTLMGDWAEDCHDTAGVQVRGVGGE